MAQLGSVGLVRALKADIGSGLCEPSKANVVKTKFALVHRVLILDDSYQDRKCSIALFMSNMLYEIWELPLAWSNQ